MKNKKLITQSELKDTLDYEPDTGDFRWRMRGPGRRTSGIAGWVNGEGYLRIRVCGGEYQAHRLAWLYVYGGWPTYQIDHINGVRTDNRIANLRDVTRSVNLRNCRRSKANTSGHTGVCWHQHSEKWIVRIHRRYIGVFEDINDAIKARKEAEREYGYSEGHGRFLLQKILK